MNLYIVFLIVLGLSLVMFFIMFRFSAKMATIRKKRAQLIEEKLFLRMPLVAIASLMERKEYQKAIEKIEEMLARDPLNATLSHLKINCYFKLGKLERALSLCDTAMDAQFRDDPSFAAKKAELLVEMKQHDKAEELLGQWLENNPRHPRLLIVKARLDVIRGKPELAEKNLKEVLRKDMSLELAIRSVEEFKEGGLLEKVKADIAAERA